jgi:ribose 5-phosphate isomerase A
MVVGLGTGSTVRHLLDAIAERRARGELQRLIGVPTSEATRLRSENLGIPLGTLSSHPHLDVALDGADEFDPSLDLIKGLGGALLREKLVAVAAGSFIALVDESKRVARLGEKVPLPVEVDSFGLGIQHDFLRALGADPLLRRGPDGEPRRTDGGNVILDCHFAAGILDPEGLALELDRRPGILEHGLFLKMTDRVLVASPNGVEILERVYLA